MMLHAISVLPAERAGLPHQKRRADFQIRGHRVRTQHLDVDLGQPAVALLAERPSDRRRRRRRRQQQQQQELLLLLL
jgi:hypothetical protein